MIAINKAFFGVLEKEIIPTHEDFLNKQNRRINDIDTDLVKMENTEVEGTEAHKTVVNTIVSAVCDAMEEVRKNFIHLQNGTKKSWKNNTVDFNNAMNCLEFKFNIAKKHYSWIHS